MSANNLLNRRSKDDEGGLGKHLPTGTVFGDTRKYWAEMTDAGATEKQLLSIKSDFAPKGLVLDLSCGIGRHTVPLCKAGYCVTNLGLSKSLLSMAKKYAINAVLIVGL